MMFDLDETKKKFDFCMEHGGISAEAIEFKVHEVYKLIADSTKDTETLLAAYKRKENSPAQPQDSIFRIEYKNGNWQSSIDLPGLVKDTIVDKAQTGIMEMNEEIRLDDTLYIVNYEKKDDGSIWGSITEKPIFNDNDIRKEDKREDKIKFLLHLMMENETYVDYLVKEYHLRWKYHLETNIEVATSQ